MELEPGTRTAFYSPPHRRRHRGVRGAITYDVVFGPDRCRGDRYELLVLPHGDGYRAKGIRCRGVAGRREVVFWAADLGDPGEACQAFDRSLRGESHPKTLPVDDWPQTYVVRYGDGRRARWAFFHDVSPEELRMRMGEECRPGEMVGEPVLL